MKIKVTNNMRRVIFYVLSLLVVSGCIIVFFIGEKQDNKFKQDTTMLQEANRQMKEGKYEQAETILQLLLSHHPDNYYLLWRNGYCLKQEKKYKEASEYYKRARLSRPFIVQNQKYLIEYGEVFFELKEYEKAREYLNESKKFNKDTELSAQADALLNKMNKIIK